MLAHAIHAKSDEFVGEELGQGRSDGFEVRASGYEVDVGLNGETRRGENAIAAERVFAREAGGFHETQPLFDAARLGAVAVEKRLRLVEATRLAPEHPLPVARSEEHTSELHSHFNLVCRL